MAIGSRNPWWGGCRPQLGLTLIELLIVVAIIGILAAMAVPNFLEAQTRSRVARVRADLRTVALAMESYAVDENVPPPAHGDPPFRAPGSQRLDGHGQPRSHGFGTIPPNLTTPIAYLSSVPVDAFKIGRVSDQPPSAGNAYLTSNPFDGTFIYHPIATWAAIPGSGFTDHEVAEMGAWRLMSLGPDGKYNPLDGADPSRGWIYDPTNGTVSSGFLIRTQLGSDP